MFGFWLLAYVFWLVVSGYCLLAIRFWLLSSGFWLLASGYWLLASGYWILVSDNWLLATGLWLLASGYWPLAFATLFLWIFRSDRCVIFTNSMKYYFFHVCRQQNKADKEQPLDEMTDTLRFYRPN